MVDIVTGLTVVTLCSLIPDTEGSNSTIVAEYTPSQPKVVITISIVLFAVIMAVIIAKLSNVCHDKAVINDTNNDVEISDSTRRIIRTRLALIALQRKSRHVGIGQKFFQLWSRRANSTLPRSDSFDKNKNTVINVEEMHNGDKTDTTEATSKLNTELTKSLDQNDKTSNKPTTSSSKTPSPRKSPQLSGRKESFTGPNVSSSGSRPESKQSAGPKSATGVKLSMQNNNKNKKSVTFQEHVEVSD